MLEQHPTFTREERHNAHQRQPYPTHQTLLSAHGSPLTPLMELPHFGESCRREMQVPLNGKPQRPPRLRQLGKQEVAKLLFKTNHPTEKEVFPVKFEAIPGPLAIGRKELADHQRISLVFLRVERGKLFPCFTKTHMRTTI